MLGEKDMLTKANAIFLVLIVCLGATFIVITWYNFSSLQKEIGQTPEINLQAYFSDTSSRTALNKTHPNLVTLATLESYTVQNRYHQANAILASKLWIKYLGFFTGMILSLMGGSFVVGKFREPNITITGETPPSTPAVPAGKFTLATSSPGLFLTLMGTILMVSTIVVTDKLEVTDKAVYLRSTTPPAQDSTKHQTQNTAEKDADDKDPG